MKNKIIFQQILFLNIVALLLATSCQFAPSSKESYLSDFEKFVERVEDNYENYNKKDWEWADSKFEKYNSNWYIKFKDELSAEEKLKVIELKIKYNSFRGTDVLERIYRELIDEDLDEAKKKVEEYFENDFNQDMDQLMDGVTEISDSALKVIEDIIERIDKSF